MGTKILCQWDNAAPASIRSGWKHACDYAGIPFIFWNRKETCAFDIFAKEEPTLFLGTTYDLTSDLIKCIKARPEMKVALFGSAFGPLINNIDRTKFPIDVASEDEKRNVSNLYESCQKPNLIFLHLTDSFVESVLGYWKGLFGSKIAGILNGADPFRYWQGKHYEELQSDLAIVSGYWPYKAQNINRILLPLCSEGHYNIKIWGNGKWPVAQYLGYISDELEKHAIASALVAPNISEPHSTEPSLSYDITERAFKVPLAGGNLISDDVKAIKEVYGDLVKIYRNKDELVSYIEWSKNNPQARLSYIKQMQQIVLDEHLYFSRMEKLFRELGLDMDAHHMENARHDWYEKQNYWHT